MKKTVFVASLIMIIIFSSFRLALSIDLPIIYAQDNANWSNNQYDSSDGTIGDSGCFLTSMAMVLTYYGYPIDPPTLNNWMNNNNGYADNYGSIRWDVPDRYTENVVYQNGSELDYWKTDLNLSKGYPVIAQVHTSTIGMHFVVITKKLDDDYEILDPIGGRKTSLKKEGYFVDNLLFYEGPITNPPQPKPTPIRYQNPIPNIPPSSKSERNAFLMVDNFYWYGEHNKKEVDGLVDLWVDLQEPGTKVWIATFTTDVTLLIKGIKIETDADKSRIKDEVKKVRSDPNFPLFCEMPTDLEVALKYGLESLSPELAKENTVYILTNGINDLFILSIRKDWPIDPSIYEEYKKKGIKIYPIPVPEEKWEILKEMAKKTGGILSQEVYQKDPKNSQRNTLLFAAGKPIPELIEVAQEEPAFEKKYEFKKTGEVFEDFFEIVPGTLRQEVLNLWDGSNFTIEKLVRPDGKIINPQKSSGIYFSTGTTYEIIILTSPMAGKWKFTLKGKEVPPEGEEVRVISWHDVDNKGPAIDLYYFDKFEKGPLNFDLKNITDKSGVREIGIYTRKRGETWKPIKIQRKPKRDFKKRWQPKKDGQYEVLIQALDFFGNQTAIGQTVVVDSAAPQLDNFRVRRPGLGDNRVTVSFKIKEAWPKNTSVVANDELEEISHSIRKDKVKWVFRTKNLFKSLIKLSVISEDQAGNATKIDDEFRVTFLSRVIQTARDFEELTVNRASTNFWLKLFMI